MNKVFLGVGHGGSDSGATANGLKEKDINLNIALACKAELERYGVQVGISRLQDEDDPVELEVKNVMNLILIWQWIYTPMLVVEKALKSFTQ